MLDGAFMALGVVFALLVAVLCVVSAFERVYQAGWDYRDEQVREREARERLRRIA